MKSLKLISFLLLCLFFGQDLIAQGINYQAALRNAEGEVMANKSVDLRIKLFDGNTNVYTSNKSVTSNQFGIINIIIGENDNDFEGIDWSSLNLRYEVELNSGNGFELLGNGFFQTVPYSKIATDMSISDLTDIDLNGAIEGDVIKFNNGSWSPSDDRDEQTLTFNNNTLAISNGNSVNLEEIVSQGDDWGDQRVETGPTISGNGLENDLEIARQGATAGQVLKWRSGSWSPEADLDSDNQTLNISGNTLSIDGGNSVTLPSGGGNGDITAVNAGIGLSGGGNSGAVTLNANNGNAIWNANKIQGHDVIVSDPQFGQVLSWSPDNNGFINNFQSDGDFTIGNWGGITTLDAQAGVVFLIGNDANPNNVSGHIITGNPFGQHISIDGNEILAKTSEDNIGNLFLQNDAGGRVGIGMQGGGVSHLLHVNGVARSAQSTWATSSDFRVKKNIQNIVEATKLIMQFRPVTFDWKENYKSINPNLKDNRYGFIAQEAEAVIPNMTEEIVENIGDEEISDFRVLSTDAMLPLLVRTCQEQQLLIEKQGMLIEQLEARLSALENSTTTNR